MNWSEAMREARAHGISGKAMAAEMGIHPHTLARRERDERTMKPSERASYDGILRRQMMILEQQKSDKARESLATI